MEREKERDGRGNGMPPPSTEPSLLHREHHPIETLTLTLALTLTLTLTLGEWMYNVQENECAREWMLVPY